MSEPKKSLVQIDGHQLQLSNLDKVLYPEVGFTKGEVIDYYARIAPVMLAHLGDRCVTLRRWPNGVDDKTFFQKRCPEHRPDWVPVALGAGDRGGDINYCVLDSTAALVWAANLAALELHTPMSRAPDPQNPTMVVFDLDPGSPAGMTECAQVGLALHDTLGALGLELLAKTSGSKGLQIYLPLNVESTGPADGREFALAVAQLMEKQMKGLVVVDQTKAIRKSKVLIDWSQNTGQKTTVCAYSLRAKASPTVSTPVTWDEVSAAADGDDPLYFESDDVLARVDRHGDLFADAATLEQELPRFG